MGDARVRSYRDLDVWRVGVDLVEFCYRVTKNFPAEERFGLISQIRRAAVSIPANIADGYGREMTTEYVRFLRIAPGSTKELETHAIISQRLGFLAGDAADALLVETERIGRMLRALIAALQAKQ